MMRVYAAVVQKERELISERTRAALAAAKARRRCWKVTGAGGHPTRPVRRRLPPPGPRGPLARRIGSHWKCEALRAGGITTHQGLARALTERGGGNAERERDLDSYNGGTGP
jgi:DNA invertase Pin-like site-specific DNA recombinase